ncbi:MAG: GNAT family N-acetyltransferase [Clostridia bacterium]|nr:GNAT family N-acetyltransferase [Clostridia bacterium]
MLINTPRLVITEFDTGMSNAVHLNSLDEDTRRFLPDEVFETEAEAAETIEFLISRYSSADGPFVYPVLLKSGENVGYVQAVLTERAGEWEIGYHIGKRYTKNGYATEAVRAFLPIIMDKLCIKHVVGVCLAENVASIKVLERVGFEKAYLGDGEYQGRSAKIYRAIYRSE